MDNLMQDIRYGIRMLLKKPGFTLIAVLALALGIGANSAIFSVVNSVLLRPLPFDSPDQLVMVYESRPQRGFLRGTVTPLDFIDWRAQNQVFSHVVAFNYGNYNLATGGDPERVTGVNASPDIFELLGVKPLLGRTFTPEEEKQGNHRVVILDYRFWQSQFGGDSNVIGRSLTIDGEPYTVAGVLPDGFHFIVENEDPQVWVPLSFKPDNLTRGGHFLRLLARLKPGVTIEQAQSDMTTVAGRLEQQYPDTNTGHLSFVAPLHSEIVGDVKPALLMLLGAVGLVLLIACANVANLMLARAAARQKEVAIRTALGARRLRLIRQFLTESLILALVGGSIGLLLALWGVDILTSIIPEDIPRLSEMRLDGRVLVFTFGISLLTGLIFGLAPALQASKPDLNETLKDGGRGGSAGFRRQRLLSMFVVCEIALALILLIGSGLLIKSFLRLQHTKPGFSPDNLLSMDISLPDSKYPEMINQTTYFHQLLEKVRGLPGVESATLITPLPYSQMNLSLSFSVEGRPPASPGQRTSAAWRTVGTDYFQTMKIPLLRGRAFTEKDVTGAPNAMIINDTFAKRFFPDEDPIGQHMTIGYNDTKGEIVGIVGDVKFAGLDSEPSPEMYTPYAQTPWQSTSLIVRTTASPSDMAAAVRSQVQSLDKDMPVSSIKTMDQRLSESVARPRFNTLLLSLFAAVALILSAVGIYGVMSYSVSQRTHEIGIRMALGAQKGDVVKLVVRQGMVLAGIGLVIGVGGALLLSRLMASFLFGVSATDPLTFTGVSLVLALAAFLACYIPARRATKVDPMVALRYE